MNYPASKRQRVKRPLSRSEADHASPLSLLSRPPLSLASRRGNRGGSRAAPARPLRGRELLHPARIAPVPLHGDPALVRRDDRGRPPMPVEVKLVLVSDGRRLERGGFRGRPATRRSLVVARGRLGHEPLAVAGPVGAARGAHVPAQHAGFCNVETDAGVPQTGKGIQS